MPDTERHLDIGSRIVVLVTFVLFVVALFVKGFGHGLLLEAGVFLVSVKLIMMAHKNNVVARQVTDRLDGLQTLLTRMESLLRRSELAVGPPNEAVPPTTAAHRSDDATGGDRAGG